MISQDLWIVLAAGAAATYLWRALGTALAGRMPPAGPLVDWIGCVAYAMLAGLIARMVLLPIGPLEDTSILARAAGAVVAFALFYGTGRRLLPAVIAGAGTLGLIDAGGW